MRALKKGSFQAAENGADRSLSFKEFQGGVSQGFLAPGPVISVTSSNTIGYEGIKQKQGSTRGFKCFSGAGYIRGKGSVKGPRRALARGVAVESEGGPQRLGLRVQMSFEASRQWDSI